MPLAPEEQGEFLVVPSSGEDLAQHALTLLKSHGHNISSVWHVFSAFNRWWPGYEVVLYSSYQNKRTAYLWYEGGSLKTKTVAGWFEDAVDPPAKKT